jgi:hypothetical protein
MEVGDPPTPGPHARHEWANLQDLRISDGSVMTDGTFLAKLRGPQEATSGRTINFVFGWADELERRLAAAR